MRYVGLEVCRTTEKYNQTERVIWTTVEIQDKPKKKEKKK